jgi:hypothetical protein
MPQDVCFSDLKFIIEFVYRGEIDVSQAELQVCNNCFALFRLLHNAVVLGFVNIREQLLLLRPKHVLPWCPKHVLLWHPKHVSVVVRNCIILTLEKDELPEALGLPFGLLCSFIRLMGPRTCDLPTCSIVPKSLRYSNSLIIIWYLLLKECMSTWHPLSTKIGTNFAAKRWSLGIVRLHTQATEFSWN